MPNARYLTDLVSNAATRGTLSEPKSLDPFRAWAQGLSDGQLRTALQALATELTERARKAA